MIKKLQPIIIKKRDATEIDLERKKLRLLKQNATSIDKKAANGNFQKKRLNRNRS